jgi:hypothetical protein
MYVFHGATAPIGPGLDNQTDIYRVELGYNVMKGTEYFVSL